MALPAYSRVSQTFFFIIKPCTQCRYTHTHTHSNIDLKHVQISETRLTLTTTLIFPISFILNSWTTNKCGEILAYGIRFRVYGDLVVLVLLPFFAPNSSYSQILVPIYPLFLPITTFPSSPSHLPSSSLLFKNQLKHSLWNPSPGLSLFPWAP